MIEEYGSQARYSHDLGRDYGTLCYKPCNVVATMVATMGDIFRILFLATTVWLRLHSNHGHDQATLAA